MNGERSALPAGSAGPLGLATLALIAAVALAITSPTAGHAAATGLGLVLLVVSGIALRFGRRVTGPRAYPQVYVAVALAATVLTLLVRGAVSGWAEGWSAAVAVTLAVAPAGLLTAVELPLGRAVRVGEPAGITLVHTAALAPVSVLALDGTGTLVDGKVVSSVDPVEEGHLRNLRWFAGALGHAADTPIGHAVAALAGRGNVTEAAAVDDEISGSVDRHPVRLSLTTGAAGALALGGPWDVVAVEVDGRSLGTLTIADALRPDAVAAIGELSAAGVATVLVAAPEDARAGAIADQAGCPLAISPPPGAAVVTASADAPGLAGFPGSALLGPESRHLRLAEASIGYAARAVALCRAVNSATRRGIRLAVAVPAVGALLAAAGVLVPWAAAAVALVTAVVVGAAGWRGVPAVQRVL